MMDLIVKNHYNHFSHAQRKRVESIQKFKVLVITTNPAENFELQFEVGTPSEDVKDFIESIVLEPGTKLVFAAEKTPRTSVLYYGDLLVIRKQTMFARNYYFYNYGKTLLEG